MKKVLMKSIVVLLVFSFWVTVAYSLEINSTTYSIETFEIPGQMPSFYMGINDLRQVAGSYYDDTSPYQSKGFIYDQSGIKTYDYPNSSPNELIAVSFSDINNMGMVAGTVYNLYDPNQPMIVGQAGILFDSYNDIWISPPGEPGELQESQLNGINNFNVAVGNNPASGFKIDGDQLTNLPLLQPVDINDLGQVVAYMGTLVSDPTWPEYVLWDGTNTFDLPVPGRPESINNAGQIVGSYYSSDYTRYHGYLYEDGKVTTVDIPEQQNTRLLGINENSDMVGYYTDSDGRYHGFILTSCILDPWFEETTLSNGVEYYTDRDYTVISVPSAYVGMDAILTPNDDRDLTTPTSYLLFEMPYDGNVYVAFDSRATSLPNWMSGFSDTGERIYTSLDSQPYLRVLSKSYSKGDCINLGANKAPGFSGSTVSNYIVFYGAGDPPATCTLAPRFAEKTLNNGMTYYTDRVYTLTSVPSAYIGMDTIITPNDDRDLTTASNYLTFEMPYDGTVYVAFDSRAVSEPNWMNGFIDTGYILLTSLSTQPSLKIYSKAYYEGDCVNLGANKAPGFTGSTVSNYIVFYSNGNIGPGECELDTKFNISSMAIASYYYTDRDYMITGGVPDWMIGRMMIQTPNDDRFNTAASGYIRFTNPVEWWVYVLFDSRSVSVPSWLDGWELRSERITTTLSTQPYLKVYRKMFSAGQCVDLGGNYAPGSSSETRSNYVVVYGK